MINRRPRILAIDDTPANLLALGAALAAEFDVQVAPSGAAGMLFAAESPPDLILLDVMMPEMDGYETFRRLKAEPPLKTIPVIFVTALAENDAERAGLDLGAADYITKPINVEIARLRIRNLLERERLREQVEAQRAHLEELLQARTLDLAVAKEAAETTRRANASLHESETRYRALAESAADAIVTADSEGRIVGWNGAAERMFGHTQEQIIGQPLTAIMPQRYREAHDKLHLGAAAQDPRACAAQARELHGLTRDGREIPVEISLAKWETPKGTFITGIIRDIARRKKDEIELRKLSRAVEQSPASVMITDRAGNIEYVNPQFEAMTGYTKAEVLGANPRMLQSGQTLAQTYRELWRLIGTGGEWRGELCNRRKDGSLFWEDAAISGLTDENGQVTHYVAVKGDISERRQAAEAMRQARQREIDIGTSIQHSLQGAVPEAIEGAWMAVYAEPSQVIDGDFYVVRRYHPACFEVLVGDVMGKGVPAALLGAGIKTTYNQVLADLLLAESGVRALPSPEQIVNALHRALTPQLIELASFATLALYRFDLEEGTLTYVNAGHTPGLLTRALDARVITLMGDNLPIGVVPEEVYVQTRLSVGPGDALLVFSDGLTEARNAQGEEFGMERLCGLFEAGSVADLPPATVLHAVRGELRRFTGGVPTQDDTTAFMVELHQRRRPSPRRIEQRVQPFVFMLPWSLEALATLRRHIEESARVLPEADASALLLASFEAATNILRYAPLMVGDATLACRITREDQALVVELIYPSEAFTPPANVQPDFSGKSEGGFGLYIIENSVDSAAYGSPMPGIASIRLVKRARAVVAEVR